MADKLMASRLTNASLGETIDNALGAAETALAYILGIPLDTLINQPVGTIDTEGRITTLLRLAAAAGTNGLRFRDTATDKEWRITCDDGALVIAKNTGSESSPTWEDVFSIAEDGEIQWLKIKGTYNAHGLRIVDTTSGNEVKLYLSGTYLRVAENTGTEASPTWTDRLYIDITNGVISPEPRLSEERFTSAGSHSWTVPERVTKIRIECWGGGGGGYADAAGFGGQGGCYARTTMEVVPGTDYDITVGAGGTGGGSPTNGGDTTFQDDGGGTVRCKGEGGNKGDGTLNTTPGTGDLTIAGASGVMNAVVGSDTYVIGGAAPRGAAPVSLGGASPQPGAGGSCLRTGATAGQNGGAGMCVITYVEWDW